MAPLFQNKNGEPEVTIAFIAGKLESASELTSAKYAYSAVAKYEEGLIPVLNKSKFSMFYSATVRAGIDVSDIVPEVTDDKVTLLYAQ